MTRLPTGRPGGEQIDAPHTPPDTVPAAEVARLLHDLNNLVVPLVGFAELLGEGLLPADQHPAALRAMSQAAEAVVERLRVAREVTTRAAGAPAARGRASRARDRRPPPPGRSFGAGRSLLGQQLAAEALVDEL